MRFQAVVIDSDRAEIRPYPIHAARPEAECDADLAREILAQSRVRGTPARFTSMTVTNGRTGQVTVELSQEQAERATVRISEVMP